MTIPRLIVSDKVVQKSNARFIWNNYFPKNHFVYKIMWKYIVKPEGLKDDNGRMRFGLWISKVTDTHSEYFILIPFHGNNGYAKVPQFYVIRTLTPCLIRVLRQQRVEPGE
jgi:hypothetical protein